MFNLGYTLMRCSSLLDLTRICTYRYKFLSNLIVSLPPEVRSILDFYRVALNGMFHVVYPMRAAPVDDLLTVTGGGRICRRWPQCAHHILRPEAATSNVDALMLQYSNTQMSMLGLKLHLLRARACRTGFRFQED